MTLLYELNEAINAIEGAVAKECKGRTATRIVKLPRHRWMQVLRILKFARLTWETMHNHPAWLWRQDREVSPYFVKGVDVDGFMSKYYTKNPNEAREPPENLKPGEMLKDSVR